MEDDSTMRLRSTSRRSCKLTNSPVASPPVRKSLRLPNTPKRSPARNKRQVQSTGSKNRTKRMTRKQLAALRRKPEGEAGGDSGTEENSSVDVGSAENSNCKVENDAQESEENSEEGVEAKGGDGSGDSDNDVDVEGNDDDEEGEEEEDEDDDDDDDDVKEEEEEKEEAEEAEDVAQDEESEQEDTKSSDDDTGVDVEDVAISTPQKTLAKTDQGKSKTNGKSSQDIKFMVFITNLPYTASEEDVREHFKNVPGIETISIMRDKETNKSHGRAMMVLKDYISYAKALAMHQAPMKGRSLYVAPDKRMPKGFSKGLTWNQEDKTLYKVCVSELPHRLNLKRLRKHFSAVGPVKRFLVPPNNKHEEGLQGVILELEDKDLYEKMLQLNGSVLGNQPIKVEPLARFTAGEVTKTKKRKSNDTEPEGSPEKKKVKNEEVQPVTVLVKSIANSATAKELRAFFQKVCKVLKCSLHDPAEDSRSSSKTAHVRISSKTDLEAVLALSGSKLKGQEIVIEECDEQSIKKTPRFSIFVRNLPFSTKEEDLISHFESAGIIDGVKLAKNKHNKPAGYALVEFADQASFEKAFALRGTYMKGRPLYIEPHKKMPKEMLEGITQENLSQKEKTIYRVRVSHLPLSINMKVLQKNFSTVGHVKRFVTLPQIKGEESGKIEQALILELDDKNVYKKLLKLNGSLLEDQKITIEPFSQNTSHEESKKRKTDEPEVESPSTKKIKTEEDSQDSDEPSKKHAYELFVSSVPILTTKLALRAHFEEAGQVSSCYVYDKEYDGGASKAAYVRMADEQGYKAALALQGSKLDGRKLNVDPFKAAVHRKKRFVVFVGNIPFTTKDEDLRTHFKDVGSILDVRLPLNKENKPAGYAYVEFKNQTSFEKSLALHHSFLNGRRINVEYSTSSKKKSRDKNSKVSAVKQKLFKLQTLSQKQQLASPVKKRSKPSKKQREAKRLKMSQS